MKYYYNGTSFVGAGEVLNTSSKVIKATEKALYYAEELKWPLNLGG